MNNGALVDTLLYDSKCQEKNIKALEKKVEVLSIKLKKYNKYETALNLISGLPLVMPVLRYIIRIKEIADDALMD